MPKILHSLLPKSLHFWLPFTLVIYAMMLDYGRLRLPSCEQGAVSRALEWRDLAGMIRHVVEDPNYRLRCLRSGIKIY